LLTKNFAIRLQVQASGTGRRFDFSALLIALGSAIGLMSLATWLTDLAARFLMPGSRAFREAKYTVIQPLPAEAGGAAEQGADGYTAGPLKAPQQLSRRATVAQAQPASYEMLPADSSLHADDASHSPYHSLNR